MAKFHVFPANDYAEFDVVEAERLHEFDGWVILSNEDAEEVARFRSDRLYSVIRKDAE